MAGLLLAHIPHLDRCSLSNKYARFLSILSSSCSADVTVSVLFRKAFDPSIPYSHPKVHITDHTVGDYLQQIPSSLGSRLDLVLIFFYKGLFAGWFLGWFGLSAGLL